MAATALTVTKVTRAGATLAQQNSDETNGNKIPLTGYEFFEVTNSVGSTKTFTMVAQSGDPRGNKTNKTISLTNGQVAVFGPLQKADWDDGTGFLQLTFQAGVGTGMKFRVGQLLVMNPATDTES